MKAGTRFIHNNWLNSRCSLEEIKILPFEETHQLCKITRIAKDIIYYRPVYKHGFVEQLGSKWKTTKEGFTKICYKIIIN